ncbi:hypothetical protein B0H11DRAFT_2245706 [Mycena galericulata]|nr:hypothetical protein B0H11DRAFT_2245706 [Mycena galericulata]
MASQQFSDSSQTEDSVGFGVSLSVSNQLLGKRDVPPGPVPGPHVVSNVVHAVGGDILNHKILQNGVTGTTQTSPLEYSDALVYMVHVLFSIFSREPFDLAIVSAAETILGDTLIGHQATDEPDRPSPRHLRPIRFRRIL